MRVEPKFGSDYADAASWFKKAGYCVFGVYHSDNTLAGYFTIYKDGRCLFEFDSDYQYTLSALLIFMSYAETWRAQLCQ